MQAVINLGTAILTALILFGVITIFPESVTKVKKMTNWGESSVVVAMWLVLAFAAFAAKDIIANGPMTQAVGNFVTSITAGLTAQ